MEIRPIKGTPPTANMLRALVALALAALGIAAPTEAPARGSLDARLSHLEERVASLKQHEEGVHDEAVFAMGSACAAMDGATKTRKSKPGKFKNKCATCKAGCKPASTFSGLSSMEP